MQQGLIMKICLATKLACAGDLPVYKMKVFMWMLSSFWLLTG